MKTENTKHETDKIKAYEAKGYTANYQMIEGNFTELESQRSFSAKEIKIVDEYRYEGQSNPDDNSILYILEVPNKSKGTLLMPYGPMADGELAWFMKDVCQNEINKDKTDLAKT